jgi:predicted deacetylase
MQQALDALEGYARNCRCEGGGAPCDTAEALRARLAQPEQQHSEQWWRHEVSNAFAQGYEKGRLQREWQGLTEDDALQLLPVMPYEYEVDVEMILEFASAIEAKLKDKNGTI